LARLAGSGPEAQEPTVQRYVEEPALFERRSLQRTKEIPMNLHLSSALAGLVLMASASAAAADTIVLAPEQETVIREYIKKEPLASINLPGIELNIGSTLPDTVELYEAPDVTYRYVVIDGRTVVVEPETHRIVKVLD